MSLPASPQPGWYDDGTGHQRWWDGTQWGAYHTFSAPTMNGSLNLAILVSPKSRIVAAILGFFLGGLGVDRFYLGNIGLGVAKLLLGWLTLGIWPLIDWIIILAGGAHDGNGLRVTNWQ